MAPPQQVGGFEKYVPVWGYGKQAIYDAQAGDVPAFIWHLTLTASDFYFVKSVGVSAVKLGAAGLGVAALSLADAGAAESTAATLPSKLYHYSIEANASSLGKQGLILGREGGKVFTTTVGDLTPMQAQIELALPPNRGLPGALFEIDASKLVKMGIRPVLGRLAFPEHSRRPVAGLK